MAACLADSSSSRSRFQAASVALLLVYLVGLGGRLRSFVVEPEIALLSVMLVGGVAAAALWRVALPRAIALPLVLLTCLSSLSAARGVYARAGVEALLFQLMWSGLLVLGYGLGRCRRGGALLDVLLPALALVGLVGLAQAAGLSPIEPAYMTEHGRTRLLATLNHPNNLASYLALLLPILLARSAALCRSGLAWPRGWLLVVGGAALIAVGLGTYSRGGQLGIGAGLLSLVVASALALRWRRQTVVLAITLLLLVAAGGLVSPLGHRFRLALGNLAGLADDQRAGTWRAASAMVAEHPLLGVGPGAFFVAFAGAKRPADHAELFTHAHCWYLHTASEQGLPALALLLWLLLGGMRQAWRVCRHGADLGDRLGAAGLYAGLCGYAVAGLLDVSTGVPAVAAHVWLAMGLAWGLSATPSQQVATPGRLLAPVLLLLMVLWTGWNRGHRHYQAALAAWSVGRWQDGARSLERARAWDPGQRAYSLVRIDLALLAGREADAVAMLRDLDRRRALTDSPYRLMLAWLLSRAGAEDEAVAVLRATAEGLDRAQPVAWTELGWLLAAQDSQQARLAFQQALARRSDQLGALAGSAQLAWRAGRRDELAELLAEATKVGLARDRLPRLLVAYGRLDPLLVVPPEQRGRFVRRRFSWHGAMVPALTAALYERWATTLTQAPPAASPATAPAAAPAR